MSNPRASFNFRGKFGVGSQLANLPNLLESMNRIANNENNIKQK